MRKLTAIAAAAILSLVTANALADTPLKAVSIVSGLDTPTYVTGAPGDTTHLYILEKGSGGSANIKVYDTVAKTTSTFLTIPNVATDAEEGLLGLAFDPNYTSNGMFYVNYVSTATPVGTSTIAEYHATSATSASVASAKVLLTFDQPQTNHNGGWIGFSPAGTRGDDHNLYIATGDGGNGNDQGPGHIEPGGNAQNLTSPLGKILRIHIDDPVAGTTSIPANNPFASSTNTTTREIFAYGLRNPFRDSFDRTTGTLYIGDVGQGQREEIDVQKTTTGGENYGWRLREGNISTPTVGGDPPPGYVAPILDYAHDPGVTTLAGQTVIGGYVYRGTAIPDLDGTYIFGDYLGPDAPNGRTEIFAVKYDGTSATGLTDLTSELNTGPNNNPLIENISSFGEDTAGNLYIVDISAGTIFEIVPVPEPTAISLILLGIPTLLRRRK